MKSKNKKQKVKRNKNRFFEIEPVEYSEFLENSEADKKSFLQGFISKNSFRLS